MADDTADRQVKVSADSGCFVCGSDNPLGLKANFVTTAASGSSYARLCLPAAYQGWQSVVHGGIIAALLDEACVYACRAKVDQCVTAELKVRYRQPVPVGSEIEVFGQLLDSSKKIWQAAAQLKLGPDTYAEAEAKIFVSRSDREA